MTRGGIPYELRLDDADDAVTRKAGEIRGRLVLRIDGQDVEVVMLRLDSDYCRQQQAKRWAEVHGLPRDEVAAKLRKASVLAMERWEECCGADEAEERLSDLAARFVDELGPRHHRQRRAIYFDSIGAEVATHGIWSYADDDTIDAVGRTEEGLEVSRGGQPASHRVRLQLFRDAVLMAASQAMGRIPEIEEAAEDPTVDREALRDRLEGWLLKVRTIRPDNGNPYTTTIWRWASGLVPGEHWQQFDNLPVFGRIDEGCRAPRIAAKGSVLAKETGRTSTRRLVADLRASGFGSDSFSIKVVGTSWRVIELTQAFMVTVATVTDSDGESVTRHRSEASG